MKCKECEDKGLESTVHFGMSSTTLMCYAPFYFNEDGEQVWNKDPNIITTKWNCSNGHTFETYMGRED